MYEKRVAQAKTLFVVPKTTVTTLQFVWPGTRGEGELGGEQRRMKAVFCVLTAKNELRI